MAVEVSTLNLYYFLINWPYGHCSHNTTDTLIILDNDESNSKFDTAASEDDGDLTFGTTLPLNANDHNYPVLAVAAKPFAPTESNVWQPMMPTAVTALVTAA